MAVVLSRPLVYVSFVYFCLVVFGHGASLRGRLPYVPDDHGGMMRYIPKYDKAGNKMGAKWWQPMYSLAGSPPPWQPWQKTERTEFTDPTFHPGQMKIENWDMPALQTWPTPIVTGEPGKEQEPGKKYDLKGPESPSLFKPHESQPGTPSASQMPYPTFNVRTAAMPIKEDYLKIAPELTKGSAGEKGRAGEQAGTAAGQTASAPPPAGQAGAAGQPAAAGKPAVSGDPKPPGDPGEHPTTPDGPIPPSGSPPVLLEAQSKLPIGAIAVHPIGQVVATANIDDGVHTVAHPALAGVHFGPSSNPYKSVRPSAVAFGTNPLAYHPNAVVNHPSQIGAAAVAQTKILYGMPPPKPEVVVPHNAMNPMYPYPVAAAYAHPDPMAVAAGGETALKAVSAVPKSFLETNEATQPAVTMPFSSPYPMMHGHFGQVVASANLDDGVHTVAHPALAGVNFGAASNPYKAIRPSAVAFGTNPLAYHPNAMVNHPSQIGAAAVAQTKIIYGSNPRPEIVSSHPFTAAGAAFAGVQPSVGVHPLVGVAPYAGVHPHAGVHPYAGVAPYAGVHPYAGVAPYAGVHSYAGVAANAGVHPYNGVAPYAGVHPYAGPAHPDPMAVAAGGQTALNAVSTPYSGVYPYYAGVHPAATVVAHPAALPALLAPKLLPTIEKKQDTKNAVYPLPAHVYPHHLPQAHDIDLPWFPSFGFVNPGEMVPSPIIYQEKQDRLKSLGLKESSLVPGAYQVDHKHPALTPHAPLTGFGSNWAAAARATHPGHASPYVPLTGFLPWHPSATLYNPAKGD